ncbi:MAG: arsenate reductase [Flavobacteriaceae bacterium]|nr:arsenate reductase [Flavobacteriaceae bacterium]
MKKIYHLKTCDTCRRILKSIPLDGFELQEIKNDPLTLEQLEELKHLSGNYESLFNRRAKKYRAMDLKNETLSEKDYKQLILQEYTFLKRPVVIHGNDIFIGNSKKTLELLQSKLKQ